MQKRDREQLAVADRVRLETLERFSESSIGLSIRSSIEGFTKEQLVELVLLMNMENIQRQERMVEMLSDSPEHQVRMELLTYDEAAVSGL